MNRNTRIFAVALGLAGFLSYSIPLNSAAPRATDQFGLEKLGGAGSRSSEKAGVSISLFRAIGISKSLPSNFPISKRFRGIDFDREWFDKVFKDNSLAKIGTRIRLDLFPDVSHDFLVGRIKILGPNRLVLAGKVDGVEGSTVVLVLVDHVMAGRLKFRGKLYTESSTAETRIIGC